MENGPISRYRAVLAGWGALAVLACVLLAKDMAGSPRATLTMSLVALPWVIAIVLVLLFAGRTTFAFVASLGAVSVVLAAVSAPFIVMVGGFGGRPISFAGIPSILLGGAGLGMLITGVLGVRALGGMRGTAWVAAVVPLLVLYSLNELRNYRQPDAYDLKVRESERRRAAQDPGVVRERAQRSSAAVAPVLDSVEKCLRAYRDSVPNHRFPPELKDLGPRGSGCLDGTERAGAWRLAYTTGLSDPTKGYILSAYQSDSLEWFSARPIQRIVK